MTAARWVDPHPDDHAYWDAVLPVPESTLDDDCPDLTLSEVLSRAARYQGPPELTDTELRALAALREPDDSTEDDEPGDTDDWAIPGITPDREDEDAGGLSRTSRVVLAEVAAAARAMRLEGARLYRAIAALRESDAVTETGYRSMTRLLEDHIRLDPAHLTRLTVHATALRPTVSPTGTPTPAVLPATAARVDDGEIGAEHVQIIERTITRLRALPGDAALSDDVLATTERELAKLAATRTPAALQRAATAILALLDTDGAAPDDTTPPDNELHLRERKDGTVDGKFAFRDPAAAAQFIAALAAATPPAEAAALADPDGNGPTGPHGEHGESPGANALRTLPARRAQALLDLAAEAHTRGLTIDHHGPAGDPDADDDPETEDHAGGTSTGGTRPNAEDDTVPFGAFDDDPDDTAGTDRRGDHVAADAPADQDHPDTDPSPTPGSAFDPDPELNTDSDPVPEPPDPGQNPGEPPPGKATPGRTVPRWRRPDHEGGERIALTLTVDYDTLRTQLGDKVTSLALLGDNTWIRPETARRLACDAEIIPAVLGSKSEVLDLGRKARIVPPHLRRALSLRDRHCAHPGCRRHPRKCHAHHIEHWIDGGETCPENCVLLCSYHHTLIHHSSWDIVMINGLPWFRPPAWLDPNQQLRHNRPWQVAA